MKSIKQDAVVRRVTKKKRPVSGRAPLAQTEGLSDPESSANGTQDDQITFNGHLQEHSSLLFNSSGANGLQQDPIRNRGANKHLINNVQIFNCDQNTAASKENVPLKTVSCNNDIARRVVAMSNGLPEMLKVNFVDQGPNTHATNICEIKPIQSNSITHNNMKTLELGNSRYISCAVFDETQAVIQYNTNALEECNRRTGNNRASLDMSSISRCKSIKHDHDCSCNKISKGNSLLEAYENQAKADENQVRRHNSEQKISKDNEHNLVLASVNGNDENGTASFNATCDPSIVNRDINLVRLYENRNKGRNQSNNANDGMDDYFMANDGSLDYQHPTVVLSPEIQNSAADLHVRPSCNGVSNETASDTSRVPSSQANDNGEDQGVFTDGEVGDFIDTDFPTRSGAYLPIMGGFLNSDDDEAVDVDYCPPPLELIKEKDDRSRCPHCSSREECKFFCVRRHSDSPSHDGNLPLIDELNVNGPDSLDGLQIRDISNDYPLPNGEAFYNNGFVRNEELSHSSDFDKPNASLCQRSCPSLSNLDEGLWDQPSLTSTRRTTNGNTRRCLSLANRPSCSESEGGNDTASGSSTVFTPEGDLYEFDMVDAACQNSNISASHSRDSLNYALPDEADRSPVDRYNAADSFLPHSRNCWPVWDTREGQSISNDHSSLAGAVGHNSTRRIRELDNRPYFPTNSCHVKSSGSSLSTSAGLADIRDNVVNYHNSSHENITVSGDVASSHTVENIQIMDFHCEDNCDPRGAASGNSRRLPRLGPLWTLPRSSAVTERLRGRSEEPIYEDIDLEYVRPRKPEAAVSPLLREQNADCMVSSKDKGKQPAIFRPPYVERVMLWSENDASMNQIKQIGTSACGPTAVLNTLKVFNIFVDKDMVAANIETHLRKEESPVTDYLFSRAVADYEYGRSDIRVVLVVENHWLIPMMRTVVGTTAQMLIDGIRAITSDTITGRFFHFYPTRDVHLLQWLGHWMKKGCVPIATLNLQRGCCQGWTIPDAWHHQMVYGVSSRGVYLTNPLDLSPGEVIMDQLSSDSVLLVRRQDIINRFSVEDDLSKLINDPEPRWRTMNVLGQVVNIMREAFMPRLPWYRPPATSHVSIPAIYEAGITLYVQKDSEAYKEVMAAPELPLRVKSDTP